METMTNPNATLDTFMELDGIRLGLKRLHAGTFWYTILVDMNATTKLTRFVRLYTYAPNTNTPRIITNPQWIIDALMKAKRHNLHECDPIQPCVALNLRKLEEQVEKENGERCMECGYIDCRCAESEMHKGPADKKNADSRTLCQGCEQETDECICPDEEDYK